MKILIIKLSSLGDIIHAIPTVRALKAALPQAEIHWLVSSHLREMAQMIPGVHVLHDFPRKGWRPGNHFLGNVKKLWKLCRRLRLEQFDQVVDLQCLLRSGLLARVTGCKKRIGLDHAREGARYFYTEMISVRERHLHAVDQNMAVLPAVIPAVDQTHQVTFSLEIPQDTHQKLKNKLETRGIGKSYILCIPGARWPSKMWPKESFQELALRLSRDYHHSVVFAGGKEEKIDWSSWQGWEQQGIFNLMGETTLTELAALVLNAGGVVGGDSGPMHLATCLQRPLLVMMGSTDPGKTGPYGTSAHVLREDLECMPCLRRICPRTDAPRLCMTRIQPEQLIQWMLSAGWIKRP